MDIVDRIDILAKRKAWSRNKVFQQLGINPSAARDWRKGKASTEKYIFRLAEILDTSEAYLKGETDDPTPPNKITEAWIKENEIRFEGGFVSIPVYGSVRAGVGGLAVEEIETYELVQLELIHGSVSDHFFLRVQGDSMEPRIVSGDLVLIRKQQSVDSGDLGVVIIDDEEGVLKYIHHSGPFGKPGNGKSYWIELRSANHNYPPRRFEGEDVMRVMVAGKAVMMTARL